MAKVLASKLGWDATRVHLRDDTSRGQSRGGHSPCTQPTPGPIPGIPFGSLQALPRLLNVDPGGTPEFPNKQNPPPQKKRRKANQHQGSWAKMVLLRALFPPVGISPQGSALFPRTDSPGLGFGSLGVTIILMSIGEKLPLGLDKTISLSQSVFPSARKPPSVSVLICDSALADNNGLQHCPFLPFLQNRTC